MEQKYRILYNEKMVVDVLEDYGTTYIGNGTDLMVLVETKENAKVMLKSIGINTALLEVDNYISDPEDFITEDLQLPEEIE